MNLKHIGLIGAAMAAASGAALVATAPAQARSVAWATPDQGEKLDRITMKDGRVIEGKILEETASSVQIDVHIKLGTIENIVTTTYSKAEIVKIEKGVVDAADGVDTGDADGDPGIGGGVIGSGGSSRADVEVPEGATTYMTVELTGEFGHDISVTPMGDVLREAKRYEPDIIVFKIDCTYSTFGQEKMDFDPDGAGAAYDQLEVVRGLQTMLTDDIRDDPEWVKKPRLVFWVKKALGGVAFLPFVAPDVFFTSDGQLGGIGYLDFIFGDTGDDVVREKQRSLRMKRAEGLAIKGGHNPLIIRAMSRVDCKLARRFEDGRWVLYEGVASDPVNQLTDDGGMTIGARDTVQEIIRYQGNDVLTLRADIANEIGFSRGTVDRLEDLVFEMGDSRNYYVFETRANDIMRRWSEDLVRNERNFRRLFDEYRTLRIDAPGDYKARTKYRGTQIRLLRQMKGILDRYGEAINPREIYGDAEGWDMEISIRIDQIQQLQRLDRPDDMGGGGGGGGR